jgi:hypothetical protein
LTVLRNFIHMAKKLISEVFEYAAKLKTKEEKKKFLLANSSLPLRDIIKGGFDESIKFNIPDGTPPYTKDDAPIGHQPSTLYNQTRKFKYFVKGGIGDRILPARREKMFIDLLESIHSNEADLVIAMKDKKLKGKYSGITKKLCAETFPSLFPEENKQ